jgi:hypothetical protein
MISFVGKVTQTYVFSQFKRTIIHQTCEFLRRDWESFIDGTAAIMILNFSSDMLLSKFSLAHSRSTHLRHAIKTHNKIMYTIIKVLKTSAFT